MSFLGFGDYEKAGPGVAKDAPKKRPIFQFFDIYFNRFWKLCGLNIIYFLACLPIITIGPATAAFTYVLRAFSQDRHAYILHDFIKIFKRDFKQSFAMGLIDLIIFPLLGYALYFYYYNIVNTSKVYFVFFVLMLSMSFIVVIMHYYIYMQIVLLDLKLKQIIKNSFLLTYMAFWKNLLTFLINTAIIALIVLVTVTVDISVWPFILAFIMVIPLSLMGLIICFNCFPVIKENVIDPFYKDKGEKNPEDAEKDTEGVAVFKDMGGMEEPINPKKKPVSNAKRKSSGKRIS